MSLLLRAHLAPHDFRECERKSRLSVIRGTKLAPSSMGEWDGYSPTTVRRDTIV